MSAVAASPKRRSIFRVVETGAWCAGLLCLLILLGTRVESLRAAHAAQRIQTRSAQQTTAAAEDAGTPPTERDFATYNGVIGRLEIPALGLHVPILNNYDPDSLRRGVGRIRGTAVPGGLGNFAVAGHRDTYFRPLRRIAKGMTMHVVTPEGAFDYVVDATSIVTPEDVNVLDIGDRPEMTLITCYPFDFIGAAPKRFIVRAHLVSVAG